MLNIRQRMWRREFMKACSLAALFGAAVAMSLWKKLEDAMSPFLQRMGWGKGANVKNQIGAAKGDEQQVKANAIGSRKVATKAGQKEPEVVPSDYIRVEVSGVVTDKVGEPVVLLVDKGSRKYLPIWIGSSEALAIAMALSGKKPPRPMTHDLLTTVIKALNGEVLRVVINKMEAQTYYASIVLKGAGRVQEIDARPSDSIALALRTNSPVYLTPQVASFMEPMGESEGGQSKRT
ncbi:MAG: hypothetical protein GDYSWBUE_001177 [Candidatus Fervidibacterota bacterium]